MQKIILSFLVLFITACSIDTDLNKTTANQIARPAFMVERKIDAGNFSMQAWERMHQRGTVATVYIEGDGVSMKAGAEYRIDKILPNNTPENPVALHLASRDQSKNLGYLARPCQYIKAPEEKGCDASYWQDKRYAPEVMMAYQTALNDMAARYDITGFHLVGYGGGANIAAVLAATRDDVLTLRTVAGNLSPNYTVNYHQSMPLAAESVLATDYGMKLAEVPQHHFLGAADDVIPPGVYHSYRQALGLSQCINYSVLQDADHTRGWVQTWPQLLTLMPECAEIYRELPPLPEPQEFPGDFYKTKK